MSVAETPALGALLPYFGSKRTLAPRVTRQLGPHRAYAELCMGSLAVMLHKPPAAMELANDLYGHVVNLARCMASDRWEELAARCERTIMHEELFNEAKALAKDDLDFDFVPAESVGKVTDRHVEAAYWFVVMSWMGRNGSAGTAMSNVTIARRYTSNGGSGGLRWAQVAPSMAAWHERLRAVSFTRMDAVTMAERLDDSADWVYYVDPPYLAKGTKYVYDLVAEDHGRLADILNTKRRARVVVSYYEHPRLAELYPRDRWTHIPVPVVKSLANSGASKKGSPTIAPEVLIVNGPDLDAGLFGGGE